MIGSTWDGTNYYILSNANAYQFTQFSVYNAGVDSRVYGYCAALHRRSMFGSNWDLGNKCGSRSIISQYFAILNSYWATTSR